MKSISIENFIKSIYKLSKRGTRRVKTNQLAEELQISNPAITDMIKKLSENNWVDYQRYKGFILTKKGEKIALNVLRKHRLWETFLHNILKLSKHEIHREAEMLEHGTTDFLADKLDEFLGRPEKDPHGTPIPDNQGNVFYDKSVIALSQGLIENEYQIVRLSSTDKEFYDFCQDNGLHIGTQLTVQKQYLNSKMTTVLVKNTKISVHYDIAKKIFIKNV